MSDSSAVLPPGVDAPWLEPPPPRLLPEWEPAHRAFLGNLAEVLTRRKVPYVRVMFANAAFPRTVFIPASGFWWSLLESGLWHSIALLILLISSQVWGPREQLQRPQLRGSHLVYYPINPAFPAVGSSAPASVRKQYRTSRERVIHVAREVSSERTPLVTPPDLAAVASSAGLPKTIGSTPVPPEMPGGAIPNGQRQGSGMGDAVVGPPPDLKQAAGGRSGGLGTAVIAPAPVLGSTFKGSGSAGGGGFGGVAVAPAPGVGAVSGGPRVAGPRAGIVGPAPSLQAGLRRMGKGSGGGTPLGVQAVAPSPRLSTNAGGAAGFGRRPGSGGIGEGG